MINLDDLSTARIPPTNDELWNQIAASGNDIVDTAIKLGEMADATRERTLLVMVDILVRENEHLKEALCDDDGK